MIDPPDDPIPFEDELVALVTELEQQDAVGATIRSLIHIEHQLIGLIDDALPNPKALAKSDIGFGLRVDLALACGLPSFIEPPLRSMARLRNRMAHRLEAKFTEAEMNSLSDSLGAELKDVFDQSLELIKAGGGIRGNTRRLDMDNHLDRYCMLAATVMLAIAAWRGHKSKKEVV